MDDATVQEVLEKIRKAKRPVFHAGYGIRLSGGYAAFRSVLEKLNIPVVTYWNAVDLIEDEHPLYCGRAGNMGDRPGNWAVQNADLILLLEDGVLADALSTALFVLGEDGALDYYGRHGDFELVLVTADGRVIVTPGLRDSFRETAEAYTYEYPG